MLASHQFQVFVPVRRNPRLEEEGRRTKPLHGTPQGYLPSVLGVGFVTTPDVNSWPTGRP
jgi:hypothetical protein